MQIALLYAHQSFTTITTKHANVGSASGRYKLGCYNGLKKAYCFGMIRLLCSTFMCASCRPFAWRICAVVQAKSMRKTTIKYRLLSKTSNLIYNIDLKARNAGHVIKILIFLDSSISIFKLLS